MPELVIEMLDAGAGDAFIVHTYEDSGHVWTAVVDGGPARTADRGLKTLIWQVALPSLSPKRASAFIDLLAVTHIDSDHIGGAVQLVRDTSRRVARQWFRSISRRCGTTASPS